MKFENKGKWFNESEDTDKDMLNDEQQELAMEDDAGDLLAEDELDLANEDIDDDSEDIFNDEEQVDEACKQKDESAQKNEVRYIDPANLDKYSKDEIEEVTTASGEKRYKRKGGAPAMQTKPTAKSKSKINITKNVQTGYDLQRKIADAKLKGFHAYVERTQDKLNAMNTANVQKLLDSGDIESLKNYIDNAPDIDKIDSELLSKAKDATKSTAVTAKITPKYDPARLKSKIKTAINDIVKQNKGNRVPAGVSSYVKASTAGEVAAEMMKENPDKAEEILLDTMQLLKWQDNDRVKYAAMQKLKDYPEILKQLKHK